MNAVTERPNLSWTRGGPQWLDGGTHTVSKAQVREQRHYTAWRKGNGSHAATHLGEFATADLAKAACERDAGERR